MDIGLGIAFAIDIGIRPPGIRGPMEHNVREAG
jgi:hypothetical protein